MESPPYVSSIDSLDSVSTDEQLQHEEIFFVGLLREAANLLFGSTLELSTRIRSGNIERGQVATNERLLNYYFGDNPIYLEEIFRRRFRMSRRLFKRIVNDLEAEYAYFRELCDARGKKGFYVIQKCTSAIRQLAYRVASDSLDEYLRMGVQTTWDFYTISAEVLVSFMVEFIYEEYHGFPGMLGSVHCTHWAWANCPVAWRGQFMRGDHEHPTLMQEAVASHDLWIWHAYFGIAGSNNDTNVLNQSPIFNDIYDGKAPECPFEVNGFTY